MKPKIAIVRGKFLNRYEMQFYEPLIDRYDITGFGSLTAFHDKYQFPVIKLPSPIDLPDFPYKMPTLNRLFVDAHYLFGLEKKLLGFDIVHSAESYFHYTQQCLNARAKGYVKKVVATILENIPYNNESIWGRSQFKKRSRSELDSMIAISERTREALILEGADPKKITLISHYVDTKRFFSKKEKNNMKETVILFVGRLEKYKGVYEIIYAAKFLFMDRDLERNNLSFVLVGNGSERENLLKLEKKLNIEKFVKHIQLSYEDMPHVYNMADIYVAPSKATDTWQEQYNTTLLEAQSCGLPIITTASGGITENVGDAAIIVQPGDFLSLALAIKKFIMSPKMCREYSHRARRRAETVHDVKFGAGKLDELYQSLLS